MEERKQIAGLTCWILNARSILAHKAKLPWKPLREPHYPGLGRSTDLSLHVLIHILIIVLHLDVVLKDVGVVLVLPRLGKEQMMEAAPCSWIRGVY